MENTQRYLTLPKKMTMNAIVGINDQMMKIIQVNSEIASFVINRDEHSIRCYGTPLALNIAQTLLDNQFRYPWENGLYKYLDYHELYPSDIQLIDESKSIVITIECYPKAKYHFLVIVTDRKITGMFIKKCLEISSLAMENRFDEINTREKNVGIIVPYENVCKLIYE